ncbi:hypothetical protein CaCOL14_002986 [Colletotrichum acutatum]
MTEPYGSWDLGSTNSRASSPSVVGCGHFDASPAFCRCAAVVGAPAAYRVPHATSLVGRNLRMPSQTSDGGQRRYQQTGAKQCRLSLAQHRFAFGTQGFHYFTQRFARLALHCIAIRAQHHSDGVMAESLQDRNWTSPFP